jgi:hypothetical protein
MKNKLFQAGILSLALVFGFLFIACGDDNGGTPDDGYIAGGLAVKAVEGGIELTFVKSKTPAGTGGFLIYCNGASTNKWVENKWDAEKGDWKDGYKPNGDGNQTFLYPFVTANTAYTFYIVYDPSNKRTTEVSATATGGAGNKDDLKVKDSSGNVYDKDYPLQLAYDYLTTTVRVPQNVTLDLSAFDQFTGEKGYLYEFSDQNGYLGDSWSDEGIASDYATGFNLSSPNGYWVNKPPVAYVSVSLYYAVKIDEEWFYFFFGKTDNTFLWVNGALTATAESNGIKLTFIKDNIPKGTYGFSIYCDDVYLKWLANKWDDEKDEWKDGYTPNEDGNQTFLIPFVQQDNEYRFHIVFEPSNKRTSYNFVTATGGLGFKDDYKVKVMSGGSETDNRNILTLDGSTIKLKSGFTLDVAEFNDPLKFPEQGYYYEFWDNKGWLGDTTRTFNGPDLNLSEPSNNYSAQRTPVGTVRATLYYGVACETGGERFFYDIASLENIPATAIPSSAVAPPPTP